MKKGKSYEVFISHTHTITVHDVEDMEAAFRSALSSLNHGHKGKVGTVSVGGYGITRRKKDEDSE